MVCNGISIRIAASLASLSFAAGFAQAQTSFAVLLSGSTLEDRCSEARGGWPTLTWGGSPPDDGSVFAKKDLGKPKYEDIKFRIGMGAQGGLFEWFNDTFNGKGSEKKVTVRGWDPKKKEAIIGSSDRTYPSGIVFEGGPMDSDKEATAEISLANSGFASTKEPTKPGPVPTPIAALSGRSFTLDGTRSIDDGTITPIRLQRTSDLVIRQVGLLSDGTDRPFYDIDDLTVKLTKADAGRMLEWYESYVLKGDQRPENERILRMVYNDSRGNPLLKVTIRVGLLRLTDASGRNRALSDLGPDDLLEAQLVGKKDKNDVDIIIRKF